MNSAIHKRIGLATLMACAGRTALTVLIPLAGVAAQVQAATFVSDPSQSRLEFAGTQAGAEFKGEFKTFSSVVSFAPDDPSTGRIEVQIDLNSLDSNDADRDKTMRSSDFFDVAHSPAARYVTGLMTKTASGFHAVGALTLRGVTKDVPIDFKFVPEGARAKLEGDAKVKRLDFGVGQGEWKSTEWVGNDVKVHFLLILKPKA